MILVSKDYIARVHGTTESIRALYCAQFTPPSSRLQSELQGRVDIERPWLIVTTLLELHGMGAEVLNFTA